jgi:hypothetical protein
MSAAFIFGAVVGATVLSQFLWKSYVDRLQTRGPNTERIIGELRPELDLSEEQSKRLTEVLTDHRQKMKALHDDLKPKVEERLESLRSDVEAILTPEQAERWNARYIELKDRWLPPDRKLPPGQQRPQGRRPLLGAEPRQPGSPPPRRFESADTDGDGRLTMEELSSVYPERTEEILKRLDTDRDGTVSLEEFRAWQPPPPGRRHPPRN